MPDRTRHARRSLGPEDLESQLRQAARVPHADPSPATRTPAPATHPVLDLQQRAGNRATTIAVQRYVTDRRGTRIKDTDARSALIKQFQVAETDQESMAIIDAVIRDGSPHTYDEAAAMMPPPRYRPSGARETTLGTTDENYGPRPLGFPDHETFALFLHSIYANILVDDAVVVIHGSSLTGQSYQDKGGGSRLFDVGRDSDYDVAIASPALWGLALEPGSGVKIRGDHSEPLTADGLAALNLTAAHAAANFNARREVNFMLYEDVAHATQHEGPSLVAPRGDDYREAFTQLMGNVG